MYSHINKKSKIVKIEYGISSVIQQCEGKTGVVKGIKKLEECNIAYLIEFLDDSRIWITEKELRFLA